MNIVINPLYNDVAPFINQLSLLYDTEGEEIYKSRNELRLFHAGERKIVVKSFKVPHLVNRIAYTFFRPSKACRSYRYSLAIMDRGFHVPEPVAYIETFETGLLKNSYYASGYTGAKTIRSVFPSSYPDAEEKNTILLAFAAFTARLHETGIFHRDYSGGNILYTKDEDGNIRFELVDLNRIRFCKVSWKMGWKTFRRLDMPAETLGIVAGEYARRRNLDVEKTITQAVACNLKTMKRYLKKN
ncbi:MAG: hypothetical protein LBB84_04045 [Tannerellaceae bacterium]|jgi:serine/threonine protein kinase|nr:hypothetical protein [Tannerellaceae bacterium]